MKRLIAFILPLFTLIACTTEIGDRQEDGFYATVERPADEHPNNALSQTKVFADSGMRVLWNADDRIVIYDKHSEAAQYRFDGEDGDNAGSFSRVSGSPYEGYYKYDLVYAVYPYADDIFTYETGQICLTLPDVQYYRENSFGPGANTMVSATSGHQMHFKNLCGYLSLKLYGEGVTVKKIVLRGNNEEPLTGQVTVTATENDDPTVELTKYWRYCTITLDCGDGVELGATAADYKEFWIVVPPTTFEYGFTITVTDKFGGVYTKSTEKSLTVARNRISRMSPLRADTDKMTLLEDPELGEEWDWVWRW
jgi:hypothetical protein